MKKYMLMNKGADFTGLGEKLNIDPMIVRILRNKGFTGEDEMRSYLYADLKEIHSPWLLPNIDEAVDILIKKINNNSKIRIIGDYDIDGVQSTYILYDALKRLGADVSYTIPDRIADGYGINVNLIELAIKDGADTILTCDNGISAFEQIEYAKSKGLTVIVTDHHDIPFSLGENEEKIERLVKADVIVNPKLNSKTPYPFPGICGAVVAWKYMMALYDRLNRSEDVMRMYLENAAFATVGDVMDLCDENRIIVKYGLLALKNTSNPGMSALIEGTKIDIEQLSAYHIGFVLGPCINASGRLDTAKRSLSLLLETDEKKAKALAGELIELNDTRKDMTAKGEEAAFEEVDNTDLKYDRVLVVYLKDLHESLAGIVAGRVRERYGKPAFVLTGTEDGTVKGSGRSIDAFHMSDALQEVEDLLLKYGGHPLAAGLSIEEDKIGEFRKRLNENCKLKEEDFVEKVSIDAVLPLSYISADFIDTLKVLEPFGKGNSKPVFAATDVKILYPKLLGANGRVMRCKLEDKNGFGYNAVYFGDANAMISKIDNESEYRIIYYPKRDDYRGGDEFQIVIDDIL